MTRANRNPFFYCLLGICSFFLLFVPRPGLAAVSIEGQVPQAVSAMARQIDRQVAGRLHMETPAQGVSIAITVPVDANDLEASNPLARQVAEDLARWFVQAGYSVQEIRTSRTLLFDPPTGEMLLTRRQNLLAAETLHSTAIVAGTYTVTARSVRFNIRVVQTNNQEVLGMSSITIPVTSEIRPLLGAGARGAGIALFEPSVATTLP